MLALQQQVIQTRAYDSTVIEAVQELLASRNFPSVVAIASEALQNDPHNTDMRLLRAQALLALRRDADAQADLSRCLQQKTRCALGYRLLGELCFRRDEFDAAQLFLNEAIRLDPSDECAQDLAAVVRRFLRLTPKPVVQPIMTVSAVGSVSDSFPSEFQDTRPQTPQFPQPPQIPKPQIEIVEDIDIDAPFFAQPSYFDRKLDLDFADSMDGITIATPPMFVVDGIEQHPWLSPNFETIFASTAGPKTVPGHRNKRMAQGSEFDEPTIPAATFTHPVSTSEHRRVDSTKALRKRRKLPPPSHWA